MSIEYKSKKCDTSIKNKNNCFALYNNILSEIELQNNNDIIKQQENVSIEKKQHNNNEVIKIGYENMIKSMDHNLKTLYRLNNIVESPNITFDYMISSTDAYENKHQLIYKCINCNIFTKHLYFRDIQILNMMIERINVSLISNKNKQDLNYLEDQVIELLNKIKKN